MTRLTGVSALALLTACASMGPVARPAGSINLSPLAVFSPEAGVICDDIRAAGASAMVSGACFDRKGLSLGFTKIYFGDATASRIMARINDLGQDFDLTIFTLSDGVTCNVRYQRCWTSGGKPANEHMTALFGS